MATSASEDGLPGAAVPAERGRDSGTGRYGSGYMQGILTRLGRVSPVWLAFFGSLLLSLVAVSGVVTIARDAAFYIDIAQQVNGQGPQVAMKLFDWPWFPLLLAYTHSLFGLPYEAAAYLWCALFMAGTCALLVDCTRQRVPDAGHWACLVVLAMPAFNQFRYDILREFGFWFFCSLALWLALRWQARGGWWRATSIHLALLAAALFRLEALVLLAALALWQLPELRSREGRLRILQLAALPLLAVAVGALMLLAMGGLTSARVNYYLSLLDPRQVFVSFDALSRQFSASLITKYSKDETDQIIFFGLLAALLIKFVKVLGPFAATFLSRRTWSAGRCYWQEFRPFAWAALLYLGVLMLFFVRLQFMNARYTSFLNLLVVPLVAVSLMLFARNFPRLAKGLVVLALLAMLDNVVSLSAKKTHYIEAGHWVAQHIEPAAPVYYDDGRIAYYAGRGYPKSDLTREAAMGPERAGQYRYFLIEADADEPWLKDWLAQRNARVLARFANRKGDAVLVIGN